jgi:hypothetical protein
MAELLVIVPDEWRVEAERLVRFKNDTGMSAQLLTLGVIEGSTAGVDQPERIKRAIERHHRLERTRYVLLAGDVDVFPVRYLKATNTEWGTVWYPSDLYYADLYDQSGAFEDWDANGNGVYAELDFQKVTSPSFNIDQIDLYPDVVVGRVPASNRDEWVRYVDKILAYESAARESRDHGYPDAWFRRAVFVVDGDPRPFGDETESSQHEAPLAAAGITPIRRYQDDPPWSGNDPADHKRRADELVRLLDAGAGFLHVMGHGGRSGFAGWLSANDVARLANPEKLPLVLAISCYTAQFHTELNAYRTLLGGDWTGSAADKPDRPAPAPLQHAHHDRDSMAEAFLVKRPTGAIAYLGCVSKYEHGGKVLGRYITEAFRDLPTPPVLGDMWQRALTSFVTNELGGGKIGMGPYYAFIHAHKVMLFGDPSLRVGGLAPLAAGSGVPVLPAPTLISIMGD